MKVLMIDGSLNKKGCTYTALGEVAAELECNGVESEIKHIGNKAIAGCQACMACWETGFCALKADPVNKFAEALVEADALIVGSPVYFAAPNGALCALLDRMFFSSKSRFALKPAASGAKLPQGWQHGFI